MRKAQGIWLPSFLLLATPGFGHTVGGALFNGDSDIAVQQLFLNWKEAGDAVEIGGLKCLFWTAHCVDPKLDPNADERASGRTMSKAVFTFTPNYIYVVAYYPGVASSGNERREAGAGGTQQSFSQNWPDDTPPPGSPFVQFATPSTPSAPTSGVLVYEPATPGEIGQLLRNLDLAQAFGSGVPDAPGLGDSLHSPEPSTLGLLAAAIAGCTLFRKKLWGGL